MGAGGGAVALRLLDFFFELQFVLLLAEFGDLFFEAGEFIRRGVFDAVVHALPRHRQRAQQQRDGGAKEKFHRVHAGDDGWPGHECQRVAQATGGRTTADFCWWQLPAMGGYPAIPLPPVRRPPCLACPPGGPDRRTGISGGLIPGPIGVIMGHARPSHRQSDIPMSAPRTTPHKADIAELEMFEGLGMESVFVVSSVRQAGLAMQELMKAGTVGFDTESKPTFHKGQKSAGPHVLQFATLEKAFIFQSYFVESHPAIIELLQSPDLTKIGFGLGGDLQQISSRFGIRPSGIVDLDRSFRQLGYRNAVGAKSAIAMFFNRKLLKSKSVTTSNWAARELSERQLLYAANDAYAAIRVFHALRESLNEPSSGFRPPRAVPGPKSIIKKHLQYLLAVAGKFAITTCDEINSDNRTCRSRGADQFLQYLYRPRS